MPSIWSESWETARVLHNKQSFTIGVQPRAATYDPATSVQRPARLYSQGETGRDIQRVGVLRVYDLNPTPIWHATRGPCGLLKGALKGAL